MCVEIFENVNAKLWNFFSSTAYCSFVFYIGSEKFIEQQLSGVSNPKWASNSLKLVIGWNVLP